VFTSDRKILAKIPLKEVMEQLNYPSIVRVHKSYAVNMDHIVKIKYNEIYIGETSIPIGRAYKEELKKNIKII
jgi:DNA-binding LytR/AlgR family response regulator